MVRESEPLASRKETRRGAEIICQGMERSKVEDLGGDFQEDRQLEGGYEIRKVSRLPTSKLVIKAI
jgi:hypothetical protein